MTETSNQTASDSSECEHTILRRTQGLDNSFNDVIIIRGANHVAAQFNLVYFGGDIQDYPEEMKKSSTSRNFTQWNLVDTGTLLYRKFNSKANVIIIRADYFHLKCFAK